MQTDFENWKNLLLISLGPICEKQGGQFVGLWEVAKSLEYEFTEGWLSKASAIFRDEGLIDLRELPGQAALTMVRLTGTGHWESDRLRQALVATMPPPVPPASASPEQLHPVVVDYPMSMEFLSSVGPAPPASAPEGGAEAAAPPPPSPRPQAEPHPETADRTAQDIADQRRGLVAAAIPLAAEVAREGRLHAVTIGVEHPHGVTVDISVEPLGSVSIVPGPQDALTSQKPAQTMPLSVRATAAARATARATLTALPPNWEQDRAAILARLDAIEGALGQIVPLVERLEIEQRQHGGIGHNQPPEPLPIDIAQIQIGVSAANVLRIELSEEHPRREVVRLCGLALRQVVKGVGALLRWLANKGDDFVDAFMKSAGDTAGKTIIGAATLTILLEKLGVDLAEALAVVERWLRVFGLPL